MIRFRPIDAWHGPETAHRTGSPFSSGWSDTVDLLTREARAIAPFGLDRTPDIIIQLDVPEHVIRLDGHMRANTRVESPRVVVNVTSKHGPLRYQCDRFVRHSRAGASWQENVRAIALGLEALRRVDRYGIAASGEQYRGWTAIAAPAPADTPFTYETAVAFVVRNAGADPDRGGRSIDELRVHYRVACRRLHPDTGGDTARFQRLQDAWRLIQQETR